MGTHRVADHRQIQKTNAGNSLLQGKNLGGALIARVHWRSKAWTLRLAELLPSLIGWAAGGGRGKFSSSGRWKPLPVREIDLRGGCESASYGPALTQRLADSSLTNSTFSPFDQDLSLKASLIKSQSLPTQRFASGLWERLPTPVFWPGELHGLQSMGSQRVGHD